MQIFACAAQSKAGSHLASRVSVSSTRRRYRWTRESSSATAAETLSRSVPSSSFEEP